MKTIELSEKEMRYLVWALHRDVAGETVSNQKSIWDLQNGKKILDKAWDAYYDEDLHKKFALTLNPMKGILR